MLSRSFPLLRYPPQRARALRAFPIRASTLQQVYRAALRGGQCVDASTGYRDSAPADYKGRLVEAVAYQLAPRRDQRPVVRWPDLDCSEKSSDGSARKQRGYEKMPGVR